MTTPKELSTRLLAMLLESSSKAAASTPVYSPTVVDLPKKKALIQIIDDSENVDKEKVLCAKNFEIDNPDSDDDSEDDNDDSPPPIYFHNTQCIDPSSSIKENAFSSVTSSNDEIQTDNNSSTNSKSERTRPNISNPPVSSATAVHPTINDTPLAELLLQDADKSKLEQRKKQQLQERKKAQKSTFGFQKGFLNSSSGKTKNQLKRDGKKCSTSGVKENAFVKGTEKDGVPNDSENKSLIYELDKEGNMIPTQSKQPPSTKANPLHLPEVEKAMSSLSANLSGNHALLESIAQSITKNPKLASLLSDPNNPKYRQNMQLLQRMQSQPKETLQQLKQEGKHEEFIEFIREFCGVLGDEFLKFGDQSVEDTKTKTISRNANNDAKDIDTLQQEKTKIRELGPLEKEALEKHRARDKSLVRTKSSSSPGDSQLQNNKNPPNHEEIQDEQVSAILSDDELRSILMDHKMQCVMQECSEGKRGVMYYLSHEEYGPKLRKLIDAGLLRLA